MTRAGARVEHAAHRRAWAPRAFFHPLWWLSLALLVLNDHWFKSAALLPPALSGKLSDFAGLLVAPPVLAGLLGALRRRPPPAGFAVGAVTFGFCAINLWPAASRALAVALQAVGLAGRLWPDPGDLIALAVLPLSYRWSRAAVLGAAPPARAPSRLAVAAGALACVATTGILEQDDESPRRNDAPEVVNATGAPLQLVISSTEGVGGCALYREPRVAALTLDAFAERRELALDEGARRRLIADATTARCGAAWLQFPGGDETYLYWRDLERLADFVADSDPRREDRRVYVRGDPEGEVRLEVGVDLDRFRPAGDAPEPACTPGAVDYDLSWTPAPLAQGFVVLADVEQGEDGCLNITWELPAEAAEDAGAGDGRQRLCVPAWAFRFEAGDVISLVEQRAPEGAARLRLTRYLDDALDRQLEVFRHAGERDLDHSLVRALEPEDCFGELTGCGAYVRPVEVRVDGHDRALHPGEEARVSAGDAAHTRLLIGPARDVAWSSEACTGADAYVGPRVSLLELRRF